MRAQIAVVGSLNTDLVVRAPHIPRPGETVIGGDFLTMPGGKGANQAVAAARLGASVAMVGRVGTDGFGQQLLANLAAAGVDHRLVVEDADAATGVALIVVEDSGQNSIVVASGANMRLSPNDVAAAESAIASAQVVLLQLESPLETVRRAAEIARAHNVTVILNPAPAQPLPADLLTLIDILTPNESETALLTGDQIQTPSEIEAAAYKLRRMGARMAILTLGERGALLAEADGTEIFSAFDVTPVDTTAAGDAFMGGLAVALGEGQPLPEAIRWGNAAGALATTRMGAQPSLPSREELEHLLRHGKTRES
ncbi:MAG: ribokinase [Chloroflexi bacterium]|nr:ribokinase [Chloroflexota bacterium]